jgi:hypothetical protein
METKRHVLTINTVVDKSAYGMAEASLDAIEEFASPIGGLFERLLAAGIGAVVDHAALAEGRELFEQARAKLEAGNAADDDMTRARACLLFVILGDRFHKVRHQQPACLLACLPACLHGGLAGWLGGLLAGLYLCFLYCRKERYRYSRYSDFLSTRPHSQTQLVVDAATSTLGLGRGNDDMNAVQVKPMTRYEIRNDTNRHAKI